MSPSKEQTAFDTGRSFEQFFADKIKPILQELDSERRSVRTRAIWVGFGVATPFIIGIGVIVFTGTWDSAPVFSLLIWGTALGFSAALWYANRQKGFFKKYKERVVAPIFARVHASFSYTPVEGISKQDVLAGGLFEEPKRFESEDKVTGHFENTEVIISDVLLKWEGGKYDDTARGIFFSADMYREATSPVFIQPHATGEVHSAVEGEVVDLESPEFEDTYDVRGDQLIARQILTPLVMEQLMKLKEQMASKTPFLVYNGTRVSVFIPTGRNLFEPRIFRGPSKEHIRQYAEDVQTFLNIVHVLNLNREVQR